MAVSKHGPVSTLGPSHSGGFKKGFLAKPDGSDALMTHHEQPHVARGMEHQDGKGLARKSTAAKLHPHTPVHVGMRSRTSLLPGMLTMTDVNGVPDAANPNPLDVMTPSQAGKRLPPPKVHDGMTAQQIANARFNGEDERAVANMPNASTAEVVRTAEHGYAAMSGFLKGGRS